MAFGLGALPLLRPALRLQRDGSIAIAATNRHSTVRWSRDVQLTSGDPTNFQCFFQPLDGGGLAYYDDSFNQFLLGADGSDLPAGWNSHEEPGLIFYGRAARPTSDGGAIFSSGAAICRLDHDGSLRWRTELPGDGNERVTGIAEDVAGRAHVLTWNDAHQGRSLVLDQGGPVISETAEGWSEQCDALFALPAGGLIVAGAAGPARGLASYSSVGHLRWQRPLSQRQFIQLEAEPDGSITAADIDSVYHLDPRGRLLWRTGADVPHGPQRRFAVTPAVTIVVWQAGLLHFLNGSGRDVSAALAAPRPQQYPSLESWWVCSPGGISYFLLLDDPAAAQSPGNVVAISPAGQPLWQTPVGPGFVLLAGTNDGLLYGRTNDRVVSSFSHGGTHEADIVCLQVMP